MERAGVIEFPCAFPIKVMGRRVEGLAERVAKVVREHAGGRVDIRERASRRGNYVAFGVTVQAESQAQLDALYRALGELDDVLVIL